MINKTSLIVLLALAISSCLCTTVNLTDEERAVASIMQLINSSNTRNPIAKLVRLSFHDCVGGCDGCLNLNNPDNRGLMRIYNQVNSQYGANFSAIMSRADFIALAGTVAIRQASLQQDCLRLSLSPNCQRPVPRITLKYGRRDCPTSPMTAVSRVFPNPHGDLTHVLDFFREEMNMTVREVVAIIGAHSLGRATLSNSGFNGRWVGTADTFSNDFYRELANGNNRWMQEEINDTESVVYPNVSYQWQNTNRTMRGPNDLLMLNSDMCLFSYIQVDDEGREVNDSCRILNTNCPQAMTAGIVNEFASDNNAFHEEFGIAFQKLIENGYNSTELVTAYGVLPTISPTALPSVSPSVSPSDSPSGGTKLSAICSIFTFALITTIIIISII